MHPSANPLQYAHSTLLFLFLSSTPGTDIGCTLRSFFVLIFTTGNTPVSKPLCRPSSLLLIDVGFAFRSAFLVTYRYHTAVKTCWMTQSDIDAYNAIRYLLSVIYPISILGIFYFDPLRRSEVDFLPFALLIVFVTLCLALISIKHVFPFFQYSSVCTLRIEPSDLLSYSAWALFLNNYVPGFFCAKAWYSYFTNDILRFYTRPFYTGLLPAEEELLVVLFKRFEFVSLGLGLEGSGSGFYAHLDFFNYPYGALLLTFVVLGLLRFSR